jgi:hypothetical protein
VSRGFFVITDAGRLVVGELRDDGEITIGRSTSSDIVLSDDTVSRRHVRVRARAGEFEVENLSETNPARLNGNTLSDATAMKEGDVVEMGNARALFHDLASSDQIGDLRCSNCNRVNPLNGKDCWHCGTSLVNAMTVTLERRLTLCRLVASDGSAHNLYWGQALSFHPGGAVEARMLEALPEDDHGAVVATSEGPEIVPGTAGSPTVGDTDVTGGWHVVRTPRTLHSGDLITSGDARFVVLVRGR